MDQTGLCRDGSGTKIETRCLPIDDLSGPSANHAIMDDPVGLPSL